MEVDKEKDTNNTNANDNLEAEETGATNYNIKQKKQNLFTNTHNSLQC